ncbi:type II secretion system F family protein [Paenibacillus sp.]|uniref:type II secretion system F family protein n=1 Tax=Paenibacillus sp. TaxID=58172 RepID=UPI002D369653|nr:type II secretion system F family protein [Paenibacillus sp.]HZG84282.1 type II secretion system F family protein [Paenibacillus sp.]
MELLSRRMGPEAEDKPEAEPLGKRLTQCLWSGFREALKHKVSTKTIARLQVQLEQAGSPFGMKAIDFRLAHLALMVGLPLLFFLYCNVLLLDLTTTAMFSFVGFLLGLLLPIYYLRAKTNQRRLQAIRELPNFLDLLTVSLEAGLGFDSALSKIVAKQHGVLQSEFRRCLEEIRLGISRKEALTGVKERLAAEPVHGMINSIIQAEKLGVGLVQVLRVQSVTVREERKRWAEETALKAPVKMLFPLIFFIFPCLFIVVLGPVVIQMIDAFS